MKRIFVTLLGLTFMVSANAQTASAQVTKVASPNAVKVMQPVVEEESLTLKESEFDFGKIPQGKPVIHVFEFTNTGKKPFSLEKVQASCGCTTPKWSNEAVAPGQTAKITVGYNAATEGPFSKPVTITYNGNLVKEIIIKGDVFKTPETSAPENSALNSLKNE